MRALSHRPTVLTVPLLLALAASGLVLLPRYAAAAPARPAAPATVTPKSLGKFEDWTAAIHQEGGQKVCYAFARPQNSVPALPGRGEVLLSVAQRGGTRDVVALSAGFAYPAGTDLQVQIDQTSHPFYTAQRSAFARQGTAAVGAMKNGRTVLVRSPGPNKAMVVDTFSLKGFAPAYAAILKECPPAGR